MFKKLVESAGNGGVGNGSVLFLQVYYNWIHGEQ